MRCKFSHARYKGPDGFCVFLYHTQDLQVPVEARRHSRYGTDWALITAVGYGLTDTSSVDVELEGTWQNSKYGMQLNVAFVVIVVVAVSWHFVRRRMHKKRH